MNDKEFSSWQLAPRFTSREVAALQLGLLPGEATDAQIDAILRRIKRDYNLAVSANLYLINQIGNNVYNEIPETALQSNAMIHLVDSKNWSPEYNHYNLYSWLLNDCDIPGEWNRSIIEEQFFNGTEIARWLRANNISSDFPFDLSVKITSISNVESNQADTSIANDEHLKAAQPIITNEPTHDPLKTDGIALIYKVSPNSSENRELWRDFAKNADRNGLDVARTVIGKGRAQSQFDPVDVGEWLVKNSKMERALVDRILNNNLPLRSAHLKDLFK